MTRPVPDGDRPTTLPAPGGGDRPTTLPAPGGGDGPMTRPVPGGDRPTTRPVPGGDRPTTLPVPGPGDRPGIGDRPTTLPAPVNPPGPGDRPGIGDRPTTLPAPGGGRPGIGDGGYWNNRPGRIEDIAGSRDWRRDRARDIRNNFLRHHPSQLPWYGPDWWNYHRHPHWHFHTHPCSYWWRWATWGAVTSWLPWNWSQPVYYYYGENVYYQNNYVYYGDQQVCTTQEYAQQAAGLAASVPQDTKPDDVEWMPLGVFALTSEDEGDPTMFLQLAVSKDGIIAGTYQNTATDTVKSVEGMVDKKTQRTAWSVVDASWPIMETGIQNLTQAETPVLVHFSKDQTQQWLMVRLEDPGVEDQVSMR